MTYEQPPWYTAALIGIFLTSVTVVWFLATHHILLVVVGGVGVFYLLQTFNAGRTRPLPRVGKALVGLGLLFIALSQILSLPSIIPTIAGISFIAGAVLTIWFARDREADRTT